MPEHFALTTNRIGSGDSDTLHSTLFSSTSSFSASSSPPSIARQKLTKGKRKRGRTFLHDMFLLVFVVGFLLSTFLNIWHGPQSKPITIPKSFRNGSDQQLQQGYHSNYGTAVEGSLKTFLASFRDKHKKQNRPIQGGEMKKNDNNVQNSATIRDSDKNYYLSSESHQLEETYQSNKAIDDSPYPDPVLSTLSCDKYGGPSQEDVQEMVYWYDIPSDAYYRSPFHIKALSRQQELDQEERSPSQLYMTFEPDGGGWNNIRMAMEAVIGIAIATGRTLVMPPQKRMYLLGRGKKHDRKHFTFIDFFPIHEIAAEHPGFNFVSMEEFLDTFAMTGQLVDTETGKVSFPPDNRTNWDGVNGRDYDVLRFWLRTVTTTAYWRPGLCLATFPQSGNHQNIESLQGMVNQILLQWYNHSNERIGPNGEYIPVPVNAPVQDRLKENLAQRPELCVYDETLQEAPIIHFQSNVKMSLRLLIHFYAFLFFEDWREDVWMKRFIRDHFRYVDEIQCAAGRIVAKIRQHVRQRNTDTKNSTDDYFDSFHVRRGDFQYKSTRISAEEIYENSKGELTPNSTIYIATDERNKTFFDPLRQYYDVMFLDDFVATELQNINPNYYGMIDQLVAARGRQFFGCYFSTFTGYIMRLRGYFSVVHKSTGYEQGLLPNTYYFVPTEEKHAMHHFAPLGGGFFNREYPMAWRDINRGIGMLPVAKVTTSGV